MFLRKCSFFIYNYSKNCKYYHKKSSLIKKKNIIEYVLHIIVVIYQKNDLTKKQSSGGPRSSSLVMQGQRMAEVRLGLQCDSYVPESSRLSHMLFFLKKVVNVAFSAWINYISYVVMTFDNFYLFFYSKKIIRTSIILFFKLKYILMIIKTKNQFKQIFLNFNLLFLILLEIRIIFIKLSSSKLNHWKQDWVCGHVKLLSHFPILRFFLIFYIYGRYW